MEPETPSLLSPKETLNRNAANPSGVHGKEAETFMDFDVAAIKDELLNPRKISKKIPEERNVISSQIAEARSQKHGSDESVSESETSLLQIDERLAAQTDALANRTGSLLYRAKEFFNIKDNKYAEIQQEIDALTQERQKLQARLQEHKDARGQLPDQREMVDAYYEKVANTPLTNEEKRKYLKPEFLSQLSTEEYIALWRRLNPYFLGHVTRQGFRDHTGGDAMLDHSSGLNSYIDSFTSTLKDNKQLRSPFAAENGLRGSSEEDVERFIETTGLFQLAENEGDAKGLLETSLTITKYAGMAPRFLDKTSIHFSSQELLDGYYGGETGSEIFYVFPADVLASQNRYYFNGLEEDFTKRQSEVTYNDVFIRPKDINDAGVSVDSGMAFLPEGARVDPETGSIYASEIKVVDGEEKRVLIQDDQKVQKFTNLMLEGLADDNVLSGIIESARTDEWDIGGNLVASANKLLEIGFDRSSAFRLAEEVLDKLYFLGISEGFKIEQEDVDKMLNKSAARWKKAENTITSKEYWDAYFVKNPEQRPKHLIYYKGNPTNAVHAFLQENGIGLADTSKQEGVLLGFEDNQIIEARNDILLNSEFEEVLSNGNKVIEKKYRKV